MTAEFLCIDVNVNVNKNRYKRQVEGLQRDRGRLRALAPDRPAKVDTGHNQK